MKFSMGPKCWNFQLGFWNKTLFIIFLSKEVLLISVFSKLNYLSYLNYLHYFKRQKEIDISKSRNSLHFCFKLDLISFLVVSMIIPIWRMVEWTFLSKLLNGQPKIYLNFNLPQSHRDNVRKLFNKPCVV